MAEPITQSLGENLVKALLTWELPLGTIRGRLDEPGPRFVDPYSKQEREAIQEVEAMPRLTQRSANR